MSGLMRWDPFDEMRSLQKQFFNDDWFGLQAKSLAIPTTDVYTNDDKELVVEAHMPNFDESDIDVFTSRTGRLSFAPKSTKKRKTRKRNTWYANRVVVSIDAFNYQSMPTKRQSEQI
jgi:HSP20 family protein